MKMYCAIIGDLVDSRKILDRKINQKKFEMILQKLNEKYQKSISAKFVITIGDEFQVLFNGVDKLVEIIQILKNEMYPLKFRFGIGLGKIVTEINPEMALGADGSAYYNARDAISQLKNTKKKYKNINSDLLLTISEQNKILDNFIRLVNVVFASLYQIENSWTEKQREAVINKIKSNLTQRELAKDLKITQSSLQRRLNGANYFVYEKLLDEVQLSINSIWDELNA
jgi:hypothetical protein